LEVAGIDPSSLRHPGSGFQGRLRALIRHPWRITLRDAQMIASLQAGAPRSTPPQKIERYFVGIEVPLEWRWGESNPRPRARRASVYRFIRPFGLSGKGQRGGAPSFPYPGLCPPRNPGRARSEPRSVAGLAAARGGAVASPSLIDAYAARARLPLLLAIKSLPNQEIGGSTCNPRSRPLRSRPVHPRYFRYANRLRRARLP